MIFEFDILTSVNLPSIRQEAVSQIICSIVILSKLTNIEFNRKRGEEMFLNIELSIIRFPKFREATTDCGLATSILET